MPGKTKHKNLAPVPSKSTATLPTLSDLPSDIEARIRQRAYELYSNRGRENGHALEDWLHAELEIVRV